MKILIIHPKDESTNFLKPIYEPLLVLSDVVDYNVKVVTGGITKEAVRSLIEEADQIMMLGHGSPYGLFAVGEFDTRADYIIDETMVAALGIKPNIFIWCNADKFVNRNHLKGFYSGMFISEVEEATYERVYGVDQEMVTESNNEFAKLMGGWIWNYATKNLQSLDELHKVVKSRYSMLAETNKVANYNAQRLYLKN